MGGNDAMAFMNDVIVPKNPAPAAPSHARAPAWLGGPCPPRRPASRPLRRHGGATPGGAGTPPRTTAALSTRAAHAPLFPCCRGAPRRVEAHRPSAPPPCVEAGLTPRGRGCLRPHSPSRTSPSLPPPGAAPRQTPTTSSSSAAAPRAWRRRCSARLGAYLVCVSHEPCHCPCHSQSPTCLSCV
jgi:hypothetical protein